MHLKKIRRHFQLHKVKRMESGFLRRTRRLFEARAVFLVIGMTREQLSELCVISLVRIPRDTVEADAKFSRLGLDSAMVELAANLPNTGLGSAVAWLAFWPNLERRA